MIDLGKYAVTVLSAYGVTLLMLGGLILWTFIQGRRTRRELALIEARLRGGDNS